MFYLCRPIDRIERGYPQRQSGRRRIRSFCLNEREFFLEKSLGHEPTVKNCAEMGGQSIFWYPVSYTEVGKTDGDDFNQAW